MDAVFALADRISVLIYGKHPRERHAGAGARRPAGGHRLSRRGDGMMLAVEKLAAGYGPAQVLFDVSFAVGAGEVVTLLGRNGMGKTTTIRTLMGLLPARGGTAQFRRRGIARPPALSHRAARPRAGAGRPAGLSDPVGRGESGRDGRRRATAQPNGPCRASTNSSRASPSGAATWATSCPAASSRCSRSGAR